MLRRGPAEAGPRLDARETPMQRVEQSTVQAGGAEVSYLEAGNGPPLVLLHGIGGGAQSFRRQLDGLSGDFRVLSWDAPGYRGSTLLAAAEPDAGDYARALGGWLAALGLGPVHLLGHSLGTLIAARFAADEPDRMLTLTLCGVARGYGPLPEAERAKRLAGRLDDLAALGPRGMAERRGPQLLGRDGTPAMLDAVVAAMAMVRPDGYRAAAHMLGAADIMTDIDRLPAGLPVQIIVGGNDRITPPAANRAVAERCRAAPCHEIAGAGHALYLEKPEEFNRLVRDFIQRNTA
jgi:pimeloyl-ACP methyl ester carboxylesterase